MLIIEKQFWPPHSFLCNKQTIPPCSFISITNLNLPDVCLISICCLTYFSPSTLEFGVLLDVLNGKVTRTLYVLAKNSTATTYQNEYSKNLQCTEYVEKGCAMGKSVETYHCFFSTYQNYTLQKSYKGKRLAHSTIQNPYLSVLEFWNS